jgi:tetratricopeptide (TPR) repeat protein
MAFLTNGVPFTNDCLTTLIFSMLTFSVSIRPLLILLALVLPATGSFAQATATDSLWQVWLDPAMPDTHRLNAGHALAWQMIYSAPDSTAALSKEALQFATEHGWTKWQAKALNTLGSTFQLRGDYTRAVEYYQRSLAIFKETDNASGQASLYVNLGLIHRRQGDLSGALDYYLKSLALVDSLRDSSGLADAYNNLGTVYSDQENYPRALEYFILALQLQERHKDRKSAAVSLNNIGAIYNRKGEYQLAREYYERSLVMREEYGDRMGMALVYGNLGLNARDNGRHDDARVYYRKAMAIQELLQEKPGLASSYYNLGDLAVEEGAYREALRWCRKSLDLSRELGAIRLERNACHCLFRAHKRLGQSGKALSWLEEYLTLSDSLNRDETDRMLAQMEFARAILADSLSREEEKLRMTIIYQQAVRSKSRLVNIALVSILLVLVLALLYRWRMMHFRKDSRFFQNKAELLEKQHLINEIALLRTQVNPHFLFNSLSILSSLVRVDPDLSEKFIDQLSRSYRYILEQKEQELVTLRTEMDFIQSYIFLLKIRFESKFDVRFFIEEVDLDRYRIPPLTLQLLIENAMKHNRMSVQEPLIVEVELSEFAILEVRNPLQPRHTSQSSTGIGLQNIITRYSLLTDKPVRARERQGKFVVEIPLLEA